MPTRDLSTHAIKEFGEQIEIDSNYEFICYDTIRKIWWRVDAQYLTSSMATNTISSGYTALLTDQVILADATSGSLTVTLPLLSTAKNKVFHIKKIDSTGNTVTIDGNGSETIDGDATKVITLQYTSIMIIASATEWHII